MHHYQVKMRRYWNNNHLVFETISRVEGEEMGLGFWIHSDVWEYICVPKAKDTTVQGISPSPLIFFFDVIERLCWAVKGDKESALSVHIVCATSNYLITFYFLIVVYQSFIAYYKSNGIPKPVTFE